MLVSRNFFNMFMYNDSIALQKENETIIVTARKKRFFADTECTCRQKKERNETG